MKICVCIKAVPAEYDWKDINDSQAFASYKDYQINPYDEYAVEEALLIAQKKENSEVILLSVGPESIRSMIETTLGMGGDRAIHIVSNHGMELQSFKTAYALKEIIEQISPDMILFGKESIDIPNHQMISMIGQLLDWSIATDITHIMLEEDQIHVDRILEKGVTEKSRLSFPALVSVTKGINEPRYPSFKNIMAAKKKEIQVYKINDLVPENIVGNSIELQNLVLLNKQSNCTFLEGDIKQQSDMVLKLINY